MLNSIFKKFNKINLEKMSSPEIFEKYGLIIEQGFNEGIAVFGRVNLNGSCNDKYGWIRKDGSIIDEGYDFCSNFCNGVAIFGRDKKYGWRNENEIIAQGFEHCSIFNQGFTDFLLNGKSYHTNLLFKSGFCICKTELILCNGQQPIKSSWLSRDGKLLGGNYDYCEDFDGELLGFGKFIDSGKIGFVNKQGKEFFEIEKNGIIYLENNGKLFSKKNLGKNN